MRTTLTLELLDYCPSSLSSTNPWVEIEVTFDTAGVQTNARILRAAGVTDTTDECVLTTVREWALPGLAGCKLNAKVFLR